MATMRRLMQARLIAARLPVAERVKGEQSHRRFQEETRSPGATASSLVASRRSLSENCPQSSPQRAVRGGEVRWMRAQMACQLRMPVTGDPGGTACTRWSRAKLQAGERGPGMKALGRGEPRAAWSVSMLYCRAQPIGAAGVELPLEMARRARAAHAGSRGVAQVASHSKMNIARAQPGPMLPY